ncbi:MAG: hypothetical protein JWL61_1652 [Gemmatimonadetes bacterium]|nr:hypothetical protein [Gemmatimonadota bacterium]
MDNEGDWIPLFEDLLRGLVHAMNNRVTALSAFAELAAVDDGALEIDMLRHEIHRLHEVSALVSVLASRSDELESLELSAVLELALEIHSHHPRMRSVPCTLEKAGAILPVRVPRWAMLRLALLMIDAAKRAGIESHAAAVAVWLSGDEAAVRLHLVTSEAMGVDAAALATRCGGALSYANREAVLELPSLLEIRRREKPRT